MKPSTLLDNDYEERKRALASDPRDGLVVGALKWIFRWDIWHLANSEFVQSVLKWKKRLNHDFTEKDAGVLNDVLKEKGLDYNFTGKDLARFKIQSVLDVYTLLVTALLFIAYVTWYRFGPLLYKTRLWFIAFLFLLVAAYRVMEMLQLDLWLHLRESRQRPATLRQLVLALIAYGHMILAFAIGHLVVSDLSSDPYGSCDPCGNCLNLRASLINALYFSAVTGVTLGYGDFSPRHTYGKCLVLLEIVVSFVFIAIILQRAVSAAPKDTL